MRGEINGIWEINTLLYCSLGVHVLASGLSPWRKKTRSRVLLSVISWLLSLSSCIPILAFCLICGISAFSHENDDDYQRKSGDLLLWASIMLLHMTGHGRERLTALSLERSELAKDGLRLLLEFVVYDVILFGFILVMQWRNTDGRLLLLVLFFVFSAWAIIYAKLLHLWNCRKVISNSPFLSTVLSPNLRGSSFINKLHTSVLNKTPTLCIQPSPKLIDYDKARVDQNLNIIYNLFYGSSVSFISDPYMVSLLICFEILCLTRLYVLEGFLFLATFRYLYIFIEKHRNPITKYEAMSRRLGFDIHDAASVCCSFTAVLTGIGALIYPPIAALLNVFHVVMMSVASHYLWSTKRSTAPGNWPFPHLLAALGSICFMLCAPNVESICFMLCAPNVGSSVVLLPLISSWLWIRFIKHCGYAIQLWFGKLSCLSEIIPVGLKSLYPAWSKTIPQFSLIEFGLSNASFKLSDTEENNFLKSWSVSNNKRYSAKAEDYILIRLRHITSKSLFDKDDLLKLKLILPVLDKHTSFEDKLLLWHLVTDILYYHGYDEEVIEDQSMTKLISRYMGYLLHVQPWIFSRQRARMLRPSSKMCIDTFPLLRRYIKEMDVREHDQFERICKMLCRSRGDNEVLPQLPKSMLHDACRVAATLKYKSRMWRFISNVWMEILAYSAVHADPIDHVRSLSEGGELVTTVWLQLSYLGFMDSAPDGTNTDATPSSSQPSLQKATGKWVFCVSPSSSPELHDDVLVESDQDVFPSAKRELVIVDGFVMKGKLLLLMMMVLPIRKRII